jgi:hypothetical protein
MESSSRLAQMWASAGDWLREQEWFQQLRAKWEELDPQSRMYLQMAAAIGAALLVVGAILSSIWSVHSLKRELADKNELLSIIQNANEELRRLKDSNAALAGGTAGAEGAAGQPWQAYIETVATGAGLDKAAVTVSAEKPGSSTDQAKESMMDVTVKKLNLRQAVRLAFMLENGARPMKLRAWQVTATDPEGYLEATYAVSAFTLVTQ